MNARTLLASSLVIDSHNDTIVAHRVKRMESLFGTQARERTHLKVDPSYPWVGSYGHWPYDLQMNIPRMAAAGINCGFFAVDCTEAYPGHLAYVMDNYGYLLHCVDAFRLAKIVRRAQDIFDAQAEGVPAILLAMEHADGTARSIHVVRALYEMGLRAIGFTHNRSSAAADGCLQQRPSVGLTPYGEALVREMNTLGMVVDLAHISESGFYHAVEISEKPVMFSHGNARALCDVPRNLTDDQLKALAQNRGVIGLSLVKFFVDAENPTVERWVDHVVHIAEVAGICTVGMGGDMDGGGMLLPNVEALPQLVEAMQARGISDDEIRLVLGGNTMRLLTEVLG